MRVFKHFNSITDASCPICNTKDDKKVVLVAKCGTKEGCNAEAVQVHLDCLELWYAVTDENINVIYQSW
jgi:hypothetical protein